MELLEFYASFAKGFYEHISGIRKGSFVAGFANGFHLHAGLTIIDRSRVIRAIGQRGSVARSFDTDILDLSNTGWREAEALGEEAALALLDLLNKEIA